MKKVTLALCMVLIFTLVLTSCGKSNETQLETNENESTEAESTKEQVLKIGAENEIAGLDPHKVPAEGSLRVFSKIYEGLIKTNKDGEFEPRLAERWEQTDDVTYVFYLRKGVKFHNGREMKAEDVKYSYDRILNPETASVAKSYFSKVKSVDVIDDYTVKFTLSEPYAPFLAYVAEVYGAIVPKEVVEENGDLMQVACGTGPFMLDEVVEGNHVTLVKNPDYYIEGQPKLDGIKFIMMPDESSRIAALRSGNIHLCKLMPQSLPLLKDNQDIEIKNYLSKDYTFVGFNMTIEPFKDERVRQAISYAINRDEIINIVYNGDAVLSGAVPEAHKKWALDVSKLDMYKQDIEKAKKLLAEAGYPDGFEVEMTVISGYQDLIDTSQLIQQQLEQVGIKATIKQLEIGQYVEAWKNKDHQMMVGTNGSGNDPDRALAFFFATDGSANVWGYSNPEYDVLMDKGRTESNEEERIKIYHEAEEMLINDAPNLFFISPKNYYFVRKEVKGFNPSTFETENFLETTIE